MKNNLKIFTFAVLLIASVAYLVSCGGGGGGDDNEAPKAMAAPGNVKAVVGDTKTAVTWNAALNATSYNIYWSTTSGVSTTSGTKITNITETSYKHTKVDGTTNLTNDGTAYYYIVTSVGSTGESVASDEVSAIPEEPTGSALAAAANLAYDGTMGQAATYAKMDEVAVSTSNKADYNVDEKRARSKIGQFTYGTDGTWTATGSNGENVILTFWDATGTDPMEITHDITDRSNYGDNVLNTTGPLDKFLDSSFTLDKTKIKMRIQVEVIKTGLTGTLSEINTTLRTALITLNGNDNASASYVMTGSGSAKLANGDNISLTAMEITASGLGTTIVGTSTTVFTVDGVEYSIVCEFDQNGCIKNTVFDNSGNEVGTVAMSGSLIIFTNSDTGKETLLSN